MRPVTESCYCLLGSFLAAYLPPLSGFPERLVFGGTRDKARSACFGSEFRISQFSRRVPLVGGNPTVMPSLMLNNYQHSPSSYLTLTLK